MAGSFLGTGLKFPPQVDPATGRFMTVSESESVKESIYLILMTQRSERFVRPDFGSEILSYTFMDMSHGAIAMMASDISDTLRRLEPRIEGVRVHAEPTQKEGVLIISIDYTLRATNSRENLVFPFYLNAAVEEEEEEPEFYEPEIVEEV
ncbi:MAG: GPW/gp25 family protein [Lachnospiraceae bacterium]|jgi:phage baseplate assembly protein W|nr:GPW/gp25 family protein [Lachnospiraceae bacterium]